MQKLSVGAIFYNEAPYLKEWLDHYINRNVDHFYLINDNSNDNFKEIIEPYIQKKYITLFNVSNEFKYEYGRQEKIYNHFFSGLKKEIDWLLICDIDEYVWSPKDINFKNLLNLMEEENVFYYKIPMVLFGSNGHIKQPEGIVKSFTKRQLIDDKYIKFKDKYAQTKILSKIEKIKKFNVHWHESDYKEFNPFFVDPNECLFRLNHYRLQSKEKWKKNLEKKDVNNYKPKYPMNFSPNLKIKKYQSIHDRNYRSMDIFYDADSEQNLIEDLGLVNQNIKYNL
jgi:hypothetical protein